MSRALFRLTLGPAAPPLLLPHQGLAVVAPFGRWLREELTLLRTEWPAVTFQRLRLAPGEMMMVVEFAAAAPPLVAALTLMRRLRHEVQAAARRRGWLPEGERLWLDQQVVVLVPGTFRSALASGVPVPAGRRSRSSTTLPARGR